MESFSCYRLPSKSVWTRDGRPRPIRKWLFAAGERARRTDRPADGLRKKQRQIYAIIATQDPNLIRDEKQTRGDNNREAGPSPLGAFRRGVTANKRTDVGLLAPNNARLFSASGKLARERTDGPHCHFQRIWMLTGGLLTPKRERHDAGLTTCTPIRGRKCSLPVSNEATG